MSLNQGWILITLTLCLVALTCLQARGSLLSKSSPLISQSRSYSILFLRGLSELAALSLAATISSTLERVKWSRVRRSTRFVDFLALQEGTSIVGLLSIAATPGVASFRTRLWTVMRLALMVLIPATGVIIMSQVDLHLVFSPISSQKPYLAFGNVEMNGTIAAEYTGFTDLFLGRNFGGFLGDPAHTVDLTPPGDRGKSCSLNAGSQNTADCRRSYFVPGELLFSAPGLILDASYPDASIILLENHRGYILDFDVGDSDAQFDVDRDCRTYTSRYLGVQAGALRVCVWNMGPNELQARLVTCPGAIASRFSCINDTSWFQNVDWTVKMSASFQTATVAYSRNNGTLLASSFDDGPAVPVNLNSSQVLEAYDHFLLDTTTLLHKNGTDLPLFSGTTFPAFLWLAQPGFTGENAANPATSNSAYATLQSLLAIPLYYCQTGVARRLIPAATDSKDASNSDLALLFSVLSPLPERNTTASFAYYGYGISASLTTLVLYIALNGIALLACIVAQVAVNLSTRTRRGGSLPQPTAFPALDLFANCTIEDDSQCVVYQGRAGSFLYGSSRMALMSWLSTLKVKSARPPQDDEGLQLFSWQDPTFGGRDARYTEATSLYSNPSSSWRQSSQSLRGYTRNYQ